MKIPSYQIYNFTAAIISATFALAVVYNYFKNQNERKTSVGRIILFLFVVLIVSLFFGEPGFISHYDLKNIANKMIKSITANFILFIGLFLLFEAIFFKKDEWRFHWIAFFAGLSEFYLIAGLFTPRIIE